MKSNDSLGTELQHVAIPFGTSMACISLAKDRIAWDLRETEVFPETDVERAVMAAVQNPTGAQSLRELALRKAHQSILLMIDDNTRSTPQHRILPIVLRELEEAGVQSHQITILICLGTHRPLGTTEIEARVGQLVMSRYSCVNLPQQPGDFVFLGYTASGTPIEVSKLYLEHDVKIAIGNIIPHMYAGWAGGAKMVMPGVTSSVTTAKTHLLASRHIDSILGNVDNLVRAEMEEIAVRTGLDFIVNTIIDEADRVVGIVAGDPVLAHRKGVEWAKPLFTRTIPSQASIVIAGARPADRDLWQGFKPLNNCGRAVRDGGVLILVIHAPEGIAPDHTELVALGTKSIAEVRTMLAENLIVDEVAAATYQAYRATRDRISVVLVSSGIDSVEAKRIGAYACTSLGEALGIAQGLTTGNDIGILPYGADVIIEISK